MKKRWILWFLWALVLAAAAMIFYFSSQDATESAKTSSGFLAWLVNLFLPGFKDMSYRQRLRILNQFQYIIRKLAHFSEFALLGVSLRLLFQALRLPRPLFWAWVAGTLYACTDELHQLWVDGRGPMWQDVCIDSAGVLAGALLTTLILWRRKRRIEKWRDQ